MNQIEIKFYAINWWGNPIYKTKHGIPITKLEEGFYTISDDTDIDSEPCFRIDDKFVIVDEFTNN